MFKTKKIVVLNKEYEVEVQTRPWNPPPGYKVPAEAGTTVTEMIYKGETNNPADTIIVWGRSESEVELRMEIALKMKILSKH